MIANQNAVPKLGVFQLAEMIVGDAHVVSSFHQPAVQSYRPLKSLEGALILLQLAECFAQVVLGSRGTRVQRQGVTESRGGWFELSQRHVDVAGVQEGGAGEPG